MIVNSEDLNREELIEALSKALRQISRLVDENKGLRDAMGKTIKTGDTKYIKDRLDD